MDPGTVDHVDPDGAGMLMQVSQLSAQISQARPVLAKPGSPLRPARLDDARSAISEPADRTVPTGPASSSQGPEGALPSENCGDAIAEEAESSPNGDDLTSASEVMVKKPLPPSCSTVVSNAVADVVRTQADLPHCIDLFAQIISLFSNCNHDLSLYELVLTISCWS